MAAAFEGAAELVPADGVVDPEVTEGATPPAATATFAWVTLPLSPGLAMRMLTLTFVGATCVVAGVGVGELAAGGVDGVASRVGVSAVVSAGSEAVSAAVEPVSADSSSGAELGSAGAGPLLSGAGDEPALGLEGSAASPSTSSTIASTPSVAPAVSAAATTSDDRRDAGDGERRRRAVVGARGRRGSDGPDEDQGARGQRPSRAQSRAIRHLLFIYGCSIRFSFIILQFVSRHIEKQRLWSEARSLCGSGWLLRSGDRQAKQEATAALLAAYHHGGDRDARARVIEQNLPLVRALARRFSRPGEPLDDLVQVASIGLIKAVDGYREERGRDLGAYAVPTIVGELRRHVRGTLPAAADGGGPGRSTTAIVDGIPDARSTAELERGETRALVHSGLRSLSRRERRIVALRYYRDLSQQRIADEVGLSQVQVSRVLATSLTKLRHAVGAG